MNEYYIQDKTAELNKRIDSAFTELNTQRNRMSGLTREYNELKQELLRLQEEQMKNRLWAYVLTGISAGLWFILLILKFI